MSSILDRCAESEAEKNRGKQNDSEKNRTQTRE